MPFSSCCVVHGRLPSAAGSGKWRWSHCSHSLVSGVSDLCCQSCLVLESKNRTASSTTAQGCRVIASPTRRKSWNETMASPTTAQSSRLLALAAMCSSMIGDPQIHSFAAFLVFFAALTDLQMVAGMHASTSRTSVAITAALMIPLIVLSDFPNRAHSNMACSRTRSLASHGNRRSTAASLRR